MTVWGMKMVSCGHNLLWEIHELPPPSSLLPPPSSLLPPPSSLSPSLLPPSLLPSLLPPSPLKREVVPIQCVVTLFHSSQADTYSVIYFQVLRQRQMSIT